MYWIKAKNENPSVNGIVGNKALKIPFDHPPHPRTPSDSLSISCPLLVFVLMGPFSLFAKSRRGLTPAPSTPGRQKGTLSPGKPPLKSS